MSQNRQSPSREQSNVGAGQQQQQQQQAGAAAAAQNKAPAGAIDGPAIIREVLGTKYECLNYLSRGATAWVWKVRRLSDGAFAVAKIVPRKPTNPNDAAAAAKAAAAAAAAGKKPEEEEKKSHHSSENELDVLRVTRHFSIVAVFDMCFTPKHETIVLEYIDSGDLMMLMRDYVKNNPGRLLSEKGIGQIFVQLAMALHHLHEHRILHRDIKSSNILLTSTGLAKLSDFGFSRRFEGTVSDNVADTPLGTPYYIAPEIWKRRKYNSKADVFSLGVVLYELMCLRRPFAGHTLRDLMEQILRGVYEPAPEMFSAELRSILASMLKVNPLERPSMADVLAQPVMQAFAMDLKKVIEEPPAGGSFAKIPPPERKSIAKDIADSMESVKTTLAKRAAMPALPAAPAPGAAPGHAVAGGESPSAAPLRPQHSMDSAAAVIGASSKAAAAGGAASPSSGAVPAAAGSQTPSSPAGLDAEKVYIEGTVNLAGDSEWKGRYVVVKATELIFKRTKASTHKQSIPLSDVQRASLATAPGSTTADDVIVLTLMQQASSQTFFLRPAGPGSVSAAVWLQKICDAHAAYQRATCGIGEDIVLEGAAQDEWA